MLQNLTLFLFLFLLCAEYEDKGIFPSLTKDNLVSFTAIGKRLIVPKGKFFCLVFVAVTVNVAVVGINAVVCIDVVWSTK